MSVPKVPARVSRDAKMAVSKASTHPSGDTRVRRYLRRTQITLVGLVVLGVLTQAVLAGQFISGVSNAIPAHGAVGGVLELTSLVLLIVAIAHRIAGERSGVALAGSLTLAVALNAQAALGWMPGAVPTAVHVPLGATIFAGAVALFIALARRRVTPAPAPPAPVETVTIQR
jgi:hypothetical protein